MADEAIKLCGHCEQAKPLSEFYKSSRSKDGRQDWCIECQRTVNATNREKRRRIEAAMRGTTSHREETLPGVKGRMSRIQREVLSMQGWLRQSRSDIDAVKAEMAEGQRRLAESMEVIGSA